MASSEQQPQPHQPIVPTCTTTKPITEAVYSCTNCDIKFDSESSLRVHLQYHGESFLGQTPGWHHTNSTSTAASTTLTSTSTSNVTSNLVDTGLSPPPSSNNSNVDEHQPMLKPLHINNNIPSSYQTTSTTSVALTTNTPTPPSSAEAISPSSVSSAATMISYEPLPSAIGPSHQMQQQSMTTSTQPQQQPQQQQQQQTMTQQQFLQQQLQHQQMQQHYQQGNNGESNNPLDNYELDASSSAEEIWDLDSHTVKRYNNASGDTTSSASGGHGSMESPLGSYGELPPPHYVPTNAMWGPGNMYPQQAPQHPQQQQTGFPSGTPHDMYGTNDWLHAAGGAGGPAGPPNSLKRPGSGGPGDEAKRIKTYQCEACDKWFTSSGHLKRHFNTTLHKNATRHQHKSGGSPRIGTPGVMDLGDNSASATSISNLNSSTSTLNSSPSPSSPHHLSSNHATSIQQQVTGGGGPTAPMGGPAAAGGAAGGGHNNNVPNSPRSFYSNSRSSPAMPPVQPGQQQGGSPAKMHMMASPMGAAPGAGGGGPQGPGPQAGGMMSPMRPLPSMKDSLSHISNSSDVMDTKPQEPLVGGTGPPNTWGNPMMGAPPPHMQVRSGYANLYSPDSVSAVNRSTYAGTTSDTSSIVMTTSDYTSMTSADLYQLQPPQQQQPQALQQGPQQPPQQNFSYHGHYNATSMDYTHTNGGGSMNSAYMMYGHQRAGPGHAYLAHPSDMSSGYGHSHSEGSVKDELDQLSVATGDLDEGLSETGTPATPTDSLEGPPTPSLAGNGQGGNVAPTPGTGEYRCNECNKAFNRLCYLKQHNKSFHNGEKPFKCGQCGKRFPVEMLYQEHLAKHAGDKPYKCEVCPKQFNHKTDLRRHMCLHTGEKPFACDVCGKGFIREDRMVKHSDTHKKKQPILMT